MHPRTPPTLIWLSLALAWPLHAAWAAPSPDSAPGARTTLPAAQCLRTDNALDWQKLDDRHILVRNLGRNYVLRLATLCLGLDDTASIDLAGAGMNRICGRLGEYVIARGERCRIETVDLVDEATYRALSSGERKPYSEN